MTKDNLLRGLFIVLLGIYLPVLSGFISFTASPLPLIAQTNFYFVLSFFCSWMICLKIVTVIRNQYDLHNRPFLKMALLCLSSAFVSATLISVAAYAWLKETNGDAEWVDVRPVTILTMGAAVVLTLVFEVARLSRERAVDIRVVHQLDNKRTKAEIQALKNQLDPHFMFNSLTTLSYLIEADPGKAVEYNNKLAQVYKYFLVNKRKDLISLEEELRFIEDYFFLLQIRHGDKLKMQIDISISERLRYFILPGALQIPLENVIKHNELTEEHPLLVTISCDGDHVKVRNEICPKSYGVPSTQIGLQNLSRRYWLACREKINIHKSNSEFIVELPLIAA